MAMYGGGSFNPWLGGGAGMGGGGGAFGTGLDPQVMHILAARNRQALPQGGGRTFDLSQIGRFAQDPRMAQFLPPQAAQFMQRQPFSWTVPDANNPLDMRRLWSSTSPTEAGPMGWQTNVTPGASSFAGSPIGRLFQSFGGGGGGGGIGGLLGNIFGRR